MRFVYLCLILLALVMLIVDLKAGKAIRLRQQILGRGSSDQAFNEGESTRYSLSQNQLRNPLLEHSSDGKWKTVTEDVWAWTECV